MKYLPLRELDSITEALNFETPDCRVVGGCDAYTTKAAGTDKRLYKDIEASLESQYASLLSFSAGLPSSQAQAAGASLNLARASPFGPLSQASSRRTYAYFIATLNASHSDYDFSQLLRPTDFRREKSVKSISNLIDTTLQNLRPSSSSSESNEASTSSVSKAEVPLNSSSLQPLTTLTCPATPNGSEKWSPRMWRLIDKVMSLGECSIYSFSPENDPFCDGEDAESSLWSFSFFFFNKARKRVCYLYLRGLSRVGNITPTGIKTPNSVLNIRTKRPASGSWSLGGTTDDEEYGRKRARFWLGDRADNAIIVGAQSSDEEDAGNSEEAIVNKHNNTARLLEAKMNQAIEEAAVRHTSGSDSDTDENDNDPATNDPTDRQIVVDGQVDDAGCPDTPSLGDSDSGGESQRSTDGES